MQKISKKDRVFSILQSNKPFIVLALIVIVMSFASPVFLTISNLRTVLLQTSINAVLAVGISFTILIGGIDLSIGSILAFTSAIGASLLLSGWNLVPAIIVVLLTGTVLGLFNGVLVSFGKLQPFIATLATMSLWRGFTLVFTQARPISLR